MVASQFERTISHLVNKNPALEIDELDPEYAMLHIKTGPNEGYETAQISVFDRENEPIYGVETDIAVPYDWEFEIVQNDSDADLFTSVHDYAEEGEMHVHVEGDIKKPKLQNLLELLVSSRNNAIQNAMEAKEEE